MDKIEAVVFDLYGTLLHIVDNKHVYSNVCAELGLTEHDERRHSRNIALTKNFDSISDFALALDPNSRVCPLFYERELKKELDSVICSYEALLVLDILQKSDIKVGLISNLATPYKKPVYDMHLHTYFDEMIFSCDAGLKKPDEQIYLNMSKALDVVPENMLMIGDTLRTDVFGPSSVGMKSLLLNDQGSRNGISNLVEVLNYVRF